MAPLPLRPSIDSSAAFWRARDAAVVAYSVDDGAFFTAAFFTETFSLEPALELAAERLPEERRSEVSGSGDLLFFSASLLRRDFGRGLGFRKLEKFIAVAQVLVLLSPISYN